jgi:hypothetical protein
MVVLEALLGQLAQRELVEDVFLQQDLLLVGRGSVEHRFPGCHDPVPQFLSVAAKHQLEQLRDGLGILLNLFLRVGVEDGQTGVDVPLGGVDSERDVDLDVLDAPDVTSRLPRELVVCVPGSAHAEEGGVGHSLGVCCDAVVLFAREVDMRGLETR